jgi:hypothetical protein
MIIKQQPSAKLAKLRDTLAAEVSQYHGLIKLSHRQNRFMRHQDLSELVALNEQWERQRPVADGFRSRRQEAQEVAARELDLPADAPLSSIVGLGGQWAGELNSLSKSHRKALTVLKRQNSLNSRLAHFCLDLIADEAKVLRSGMNSTAGGTYDDHGALSRGHGSVVVRKA